MAYSAEADRIIAEIMACGSVEEVNHVARKHGHRVQEMSDSPTLYVRAIHIKHAAAYRRAMIESDEKETTCQDQ